MKRDIEKIVEELNKGKSYKELIEEEGLSSPSTISKRLRNNGYVRNNTLTRTAQGRQRLGSISASELEDAGFDPEDDIYYSKEVRDGEIVFELAEKKYVEKEEEDESESE